MQRHVLITGASRGIGRAIALAFLARGDHVSTIDRQGVGPFLGAALEPDAGDSPARETGKSAGALRSHTTAGRPDLAVLAADVSSTEQVGAAFDQAEERFGKVDVLVVAAGMVKDRLLMRMTDQDFAEIIDTNLAGAWRCVRRAVRSMTPRRQGAIILIGSVVGSVGGAGQTNYAASKAALVGLARSVAREIGGRGITTNVIAPGFIETDMTAGLTEATRAAYQARIPAGRFGTVDDVAAAALFLADAPYVNGAVIPVDGGLGMGH